MVKAVLAGLDDTLRELGKFGRFNLMNYALLMFPSFLAGMYNSVYVFEASDIGYRCYVPECKGINASLWLKFAIPTTKGKFSKCFRYASLSNLRTSSCSPGAFDTSRKVKCSSFVYDDEDSAVRDFNLGCQDWKRTLVGTVHNSGLIIALPFTGMISDKFGRKVAISMAGCINCIFGVWRSFSNSYIMLIILEFMETGFGAGCYTTAFVFAMEIVAPETRVFFNTILNTSFVCGLMTLSGLAWILQDWRTQLKIMYAPACLLFTYFWICNESMRWLLNKGRRKDAVAILMKAAKMNKITYTKETLSTLQELEIPPKDESRVATSKPERPIFMQIIMSRIIRKRLAKCSFMWVTCTFVYYGLLINSVSLAGTKYVNFILAAFVEIPANIACLLSLDRFGRKRVMAMAYIVSAVVCIGLSFLPKSQHKLALFFFLSGKFFISMAYSTVYIYVSELFPTTVRQSLLAICSTVGRFGSALAPLTPLLALYYENLPAICFGTMAILAGIVVFTLPETINKALPNTVEDAEALSRRNLFKTNDIIIK